MAKPVKPTAPEQALRSDPDTFAVRAEDTIDYMFTTFPDYTDALGTFVDERADAALAAALGGDLPAITGQALKLLRVNAGETAAELVGVSDIAWPRGDAPTYSADLDDLDGSGVFYYDGSATNRPTPNEGIVLVGKRTTFTGTVQIALPLFGGTETEDMYFRRGSGNPLVWTSWKRVRDDQSAVIATWTHSTNVAQIDFTDLGDWDAIDVEFIRAVTSGSGVQLQFSTNNGSSFVTTGYDSQVFDQVSISSSTSGIVVTRGTSGPVSGVITLRNLAVTARHPSAGNLRIGSRVSASAGDVSTGPVNAIRILAGGNWSGGAIRLIGRRRK